MRNLLNTSMCTAFQPSFDNKECDFYQYAENSKMEIIHGECGFCKRPNSYRCVADICRTIPLSHSSVSDFLTCHYLYYLKKILGIQLRPPFYSSALKAGQLWDTIKQKHLGAKKNIQECIDKYEIDPYTVAKVRAIYHAYKELEITVDPDYELQAKVDLKFDIVIPPSAFLPNVTVGKEVINLWRERAELTDDERTWTFPLYVTGFYDRKYNNYFTEDKLSGRPEFYLDPFLIASQAGTYLMADKNLEFLLMEIVQMPQQKELKSKGNGESPHEMYERCYSDILSRPSKYFIGYNRETHKYGRKYFRREFPLDAIESRYRQIIIEILSCRWSNNFYKNFKACNNLFPGISCEMLPICKNNNMSETIFEIRNKD